MERELLPSSLDEIADMLVDEWDEWGLQPIVFWRGRWYRQEVDGVWYLRKTSWIENQFAGRLANCDYMKIMPNGTQRRLPFPVKAKSVDFAEFIRLMNRMVQRLAVSWPVINTIRTYEESEPFLYADAIEEFFGAHHIRTDPLRFRCQECNSRGGWPCMEINGKSRRPTDTHAERYFSMWHAERTRQLAAIQYANEVVKATINETEIPPLCDNGPRVGKRSTKIDYQGWPPISINKNLVSWPYGISTVFSHEIMHRSGTTPIPKQPNRLQTAYREIADICIERDLVALCRVTPYNFEASTAPSIRLALKQLSLVRKPDSTRGLAFDALIIQDNKGGYRVVRPPSDAYAP